MPSRSGVSGAGGRLLGGKGPKQPYLIRLKGGQPFACRVWVRRCTVVPSNRENGNVSRGYSRTIIMLLADTG